MRYLVYSNTGLTSRQIGLTAEIVEKLKKEGHEIRLVLCDNVLENCYFNRSHNVLGCASCQSRMWELFRMAGITSNETIRLRRFQAAYQAPIPILDSLDALMVWEYKGLPLGRGVASSIISYKRDYHLSWEKYGPLMQVELRKAMNVLHNFEAIIQDFKPDAIYLFNGRFSEVYPVVEISLKLGLPFYAIESGSVNNYELFKNHLPHSIAYRDQSMNDCWDEIEEPERSQIAIEWFERKRKGDEKYERSFTARQAQDLLPAGFDKTKMNVAIMNSSEDEMMAIMEWRTHLYKYQNDAIAQIVKHFAGNNELHFYLRVHPNLSEVDNIQVKEINEMHFPNLTIIPPDSPINTYALMDHCDKVISLGSSTGIEATYWGTPSILYGRSFYVNLGCVYAPQSFEELVDLTEQRDLSPKPRESTYKYGLYMSTYGKQTEYFKFGGLEKSTYKNKRIRKWYLASWIYLLRYLPRFSWWRKLHKIYYAESFGISAVLKYK